MRRRVILLLAVATLLALVPLWLWRLSGMPPAWWAPPDPNDALVQDLAGAVEKRLAEEAHRLRDDRELWTVRLRQEQVNAWLAARLEAWVAHERDLRWPAHVRPPQVRFERQGIRLAVEIRGGSAPRYVEVRLVSSLAQGRLVLDAQRAALGRIPLPGDPLRRMAPYLADSMGGLVSDAELSRLTGLLAGRDAIDPQIRLADGRCVELVDLRFDEGTLDLTFRTLRTAPPPQR